MLQDSIHSRPCPSECKLVGMIGHGDKDSAVDRRLLPRMDRKMGAPARDGHGSILACTL